MSAHQMRHAGDFLARTARDLAELSLHTHAPDRSAEPGTPCERCVAEIRARSEVQNAVERWKRLRGLP